MVQNGGKPRGILTQADREFLQGEKDLTAQSARNTRRRIRNRLYYALQDFQLLWRYLSDDDLEQVFACDSDEKRRVIRSSVQDMIAFAILGLGENDDLYTRRVKDAIEQAAYARDRHVTIGLGVEEELMDSTEEIIQKWMLNEDGEIPYAEFEKVCVKPDCEPEAFASFMNALPGEDEIEHEEAAEHLEAVNASEQVRHSLPYVLNVRPEFSDERVENADT